MIRSLISILALTALANAQPPNATCPFNGSDGHLEVLLPPLLDEDNTHVIFVGPENFMQVRVVVPNQYETVQIGFEGASDPAGGYNSEALIPGVYWTVDTDSDPCNVIYTSEIPFDEFRQSLGGVQVETFSEEVVFSTVIDIETTKTITVVPETLLELQEAHPEDRHLMQAGRDYLRTVRNKIPFSVTFQTQLDLSANVSVRSDTLRITPALLETSIVAVHPDRPDGIFGMARLEVLTRIPAPLILTNPGITVDQVLLQRNLTIFERVDKRDCDPNQGICSQFWQVDVYPEFCFVVGNFDMSIDAVCHPGTANCLHPTPDSASILFRVASDNFCGDTQTIELDGQLELDESSAACNQPLRGTVTVWNSDDAAINRTDIIEVRAYPALINPETPDFTFIYREIPLISRLGYTAVQTHPWQVDFQFDWRGSELRCDVTARIEVLVQVTYQATRDLGLLSTDVGSSRSPSSKALLQTDSSSDQNMIFASSAFIRADGDTSDINSDGTGAGGAAASGSLSPLMIGIVAALGAGILVAIVGCGFYVRRLKAKGATSSQQDATQGVANAQV